MTGLEFALAVAVIAGQMVAYICRLDWLSWSTARAAPVAFHLAGLVFLVACLASLLQGLPLGVGWFGLAVTGLWLVTSWHTWSEGPPQHVMTKPFKAGPACRPAAAIRGRR